MYSAPGSELLELAVDCHLHVCPHLNGRSVTVFGAVRQAAAAGMIGIGLMDNLANSGGLAALVMTELDDLRVDVFGGIILENVAGGVSSEVVEVAIGIGYGPGQGARFVSLPCHNTRHVARTENRSAAYIECCYGVPLTGELSDETKKILDLCAARDVVFNTGHVAGEEAVRLCYEAKKHGVERVIVPSTYYEVDEIREIVGTGAYAEFSFLAMSLASAVPTTSIDSEAHAVTLVTLAETIRRVKAATPKRVILSSDTGSYLVAPPVESFREFLILVQSGGFSDEEMRTMAATNPIRLFKVRPPENRAFGPGR